MEKDLRFRFYSVLKNEDAPPYLGDELLVACDGLGGDGSSVHEIDREKHPELASEIFETAFGDLTDISEDLRAYLDELISDMADDKDDTSALWGSRIVMGRFVYSLLTNPRYSIDNIKDEAVRSELCEFIKSGMIKVSEHFKLEVGGYTGQKLLPTTLAAIRYKDLGDSVRAEAMWAGDSRLYAFTSDGLRSISDDDEDESGSIVNLFYAKKEHKVRINYKVYELKKPCILMAVSDGIFDPFAPNDHLGVENIFLSELQSAESIEAMCSSLQLKFRNSGDDATVSFRAFGYESFEALKKAFAKRAKYISYTMVKLRESSQRLEVLNSSEEEFYSYVLQRSKDKLAKIVELLSASAKSDAPDIVIKNSDFIKAAAERYCEKKRRDTSVAVTFEDARTSLISSLAGRVDDPDKLLRRDSSEKLVGKIKRALASIEEKETALNKDEADLLKHEQSCEQFKARVSEMVRILKLQLVEINSDFEELKGGAGTSAFNKASGLFERFVFCQKILLFLNFRRNVDCDENSLKGQDAFLVKKTKDIVQSINLKKQEIEGDKRALENAENKYITLIEELNTALTGVHAVKRYFNFGAVKKFGFEEEKKPVKNALKAVSPDELSEIVETSAKADPEAFAVSLVRVLSENPDKPSCVDIIYNPGRLSRFKEYYMIKNCPPEDLFSFEEEINSVNAAYDELKA